MANLRVNKITGTEVFETTGSVQFDGNSRLLVIPSSALTNSAFTVETYVYFTGSTSSGNYTIFDFSNAADGYGMYSSVSSGTIYFQFYSTNASTPVWTISSSFTSYLNRWVHITTSFDGNTYRAFFDGVLVGSVSNTTQVVSLNRLTIGARSDSASPVQPWLGHISNFRYVNGTALYTKNFTPPTRELTVIPNTVLLCCQSTTRANEERTGKTITVNGNAIANELTPGLLTDRIRSGGSSSISGSVEFDGDGDYLSIPYNSSLKLTENNDWTVEFWMYASGAQSSSNNGIYAQDSGGFTGLLITANSSRQIQLTSSTTGPSSWAYLFQTIGTYTDNSWNHVAVTKSGTTVMGFFNGSLGLTITSFPSSSYTNTNTSEIGRYDTSYFNGFISNLRVIKGTALYTQNFIPPTRELKNLPGTVLLCCQDSKSAAREATGKTITVNGNATARNFAPSVGFDGFVNLDGATKIKTPNYFYLPTGNTEDRGRGRGLFGGGYVPGTSQNTIQFINIQSQGNAQDFGDLSSNMGSADGKAPCAAASATRALFASGYSAPGPVNTIEYITISSTSNSVDFGDLTTSRRDLGACASSTRALFGGGTTTGSTSATNVIEYVTIASTGNAISFGTLTQARRGVGSCSSPTRGVWGGGYVSNSPATFANRIDYVTIATTGNATTFGDLTVVRGSTTTSCSSSTRGLFVGGSIYVAPASTFYNTIDYITIASTGNATDFGDLTSTRGYIGSCSNSTRGVFGGGGNPTHVNTIEFVSITSTGNATDFGDLLSAALYYNGGCSDSHGGLG